MAIYKSRRHCQLSGAQNLGALLPTYRAILEIFPILWDLPQPAPAHSPAPRGVEKVKVVTISHPGHPAENTPVAEERRANKGSTGDAAEVVGVQLQSAEAREGEEDHGRPLLGRRELVVGTTYRVGPGDGLLRRRGFIADGFLAGA
jgi:hypothetical protein